MPYVSPGGLEEVAGRILGIVVLIYIVKSIYKYFSKKTKKKLHTKTIPNI